MLTRFQMPFGFYFERSGRWQRNFGYYWISVGCRRLFSNCYVDIPQIARQAVGKLVIVQYGFDGDTCAVLLQLTDSLLILPWVE